MSADLTPIERERLQLLIREYEWFDRRTRSLMIRLTGIAGGFLVVCLPPVFQSDFRLGGLQAAAATVVIAWLFFFACQISSQMLAYKRHMVHIAEMIKSLHSSLELQWELIHYRMVYGDLSPGGRPASRRIALKYGVIGLSLTGLVPFLALFREGLTYITDTHGFLVVLSYWFVSWPVVVAGPVLLMITRKRVGSAY